MTQQQTEKEEAQFKCSQTGRKLVGKDGKKMQNSQKKLQNQKRSKQKNKGDKETPKKDLKLA